MPNMLKLGISWNKFDLSLNKLFFWQWRNGNETVNNYYSYPNYLLLAVVFLLSIIYSILVNTAGKNCRTYNFAIYLIIIDLHVISHLEKSNFSISFNNYKYKTQKFSKNTIVMALWIMYTNLSLCTVTFRITTEWLIVTRAKCIPEPRMVLFIALYFNTIEIQWMNDCMEDQRIMTTCLLSNKWCIEPFTMRK